MFLMLSCLLIAALCPPAGKMAGLLALVSDVYCICYFPLWYPGPGVVLDCIVS